MSHLHHLISGAGGHEQHLAVFADGAVHKAHEHDDAPVIVILAVKNQGLQGRVGITGRGGDVLHDIVQHRVDVDARLGADLRRVLGRDADDLLDLVLHPLRVGGGQVDLVHHGQDLQIVVQGQVGVGKGLGLHTLGGVHHQHRALAGGQRAADLIVEVHMARGVDQVQGIGLPVGSPVIQAHRPGLDGDAPLLFQVHVVQNLVLHDALLHRAALFDQPVGKGGLAVVNVGDNGKISDKLLICHVVSLSVLPVNSSRAISARSAMARSWPIKALAASAVLFTPSGSSVRPKRKSAVTP